jgi:hypothetical protein
VTTLAPGFVLRVEDDAPNHWIAECGFVVIVLLRVGSHQDPTHVSTVARLVSRRRRLGLPKASILAICPPEVRTPPTQDVRRAFLDAAHLRAHIDRVAAVVLGEGFAPAVHRGAVTGILALIQSPKTFEITSTIAEGVYHVLGGHSPVAGPLIRICEEQARRSSVRPPSGHGAPSVGST